MQVQLLLLSIVMCWIYCGDSSLHHQDTETGHIAVYWCGLSQKTDSILAYDIEFPNGSPVTNSSDIYKGNDGDSYILYLPKQTRIDTQSFNCVRYTKTGKHKIPFTVYRTQGVEVLQVSVQDGKNLGEKKTFAVYTNGSNYCVVSRSEDGILHIKLIQEAGEGVEKMTIELSTIGVSTRQMTTPGMTTENSDGMSTHVEGNDEELKNTQKGLAYANGVGTGIGITLAVVLLVVLVLAVLKKRKIYFSFTKKDGAVHDDKQLTRMENS